MKQEAVKRMLVAGLVLLALIACARGGSGAAVQETRLYTPIVEGSAVPLTPQAFLPMVGTTGGDCQTHTAAMTLSANATTVKVGNVLTVTATLANEGCGLLGQPQYQLDIQPSSPRSLFEPPAPQPLTRQTGIESGQSDQAQFVLRAAAPGQATFIATTSFEVHLGYPAPAYWSHATSAPLNISVTP